MMAFANLGFAWALGLFGVAEVATALPAQATEVVQVKPVGNPGEWIGDDAYPATALRNKEQGRVAFTLEIGPDGLPKSCKVTQSSGSEILDIQTCYLMMTRGHFTQPRDGSGNPTTATYSNHVNWRIPVDPDPPPTPFDLLTSFDILPDGQVANCQTSKSGEVPPEIASTGCQDPNLRYDPAVDATGKKIKQHVEIEIHIHVTDVP